MTHNLVTASENRSDTYYHPCTSQRTVNRNHIQFTEIEQKEFQIPFIFHKKNMCRDKNEKRNILTNRMYIRITWTYQFCTQMT